MNNYKTIKWPLNEPIATDHEDIEAIVLWKNNAGASGYVRHLSDGNEYPASWNLDGSRIELSRGNLIPPKREPRTTDVWVRWDDKSVWRVKPAVGVCSFHLLIHPDDREPITLEDLVKITSSCGNITAAENILALLKERGYE